MNLYITQRKSILLVVLILVLLSTACLSGSGDEEVVFSPVESTEVSPTATAESPRIGRLCRPLRLPGH